MRGMIHKAQRQPKRVVFTEGEEGKILRACQILLDEKIAMPILLGDEETIRAKAEELHLHLDGAQIVDPRKFPRLHDYTEEFYSLRQRKGVTRTEAEQLILNHTTFGSMMVRLGDADALVGGLTTHYPDTIRPALQVIDVRPELRRVAGVYVLITPKGDIYFLADATVNIEPTLGGPGRDRHHGGGEGAPLQPWSRAWPCSRSPISAARAIRWPTRCGGPWSWSGSARRA